ncbi:uncharacterized protein N7483_002557 [Penicillium malachiteum]|uniref:uncharacterized protein n=1 Tax=Penicillium malachiteum TaxID=1324776 RepID=UPI002549257B|nr:uncharacterized protein N7483_002557 [Penicillium malachiteum]KAJ5737432.1 hypothetical protein N7483_002557 [Penicillium malachiteum]
MANFTTTDDEQQLAAERHRKFWGTAKIAIRQIIPHPSISQRLDQRNVQRLCEIFEKEGCRRLAAYNHVTAVVSKHHLDDALQAARVGPADTTDNPHPYPQLHFARGQVQCLHGQHRLRAAEVHLPSCDQWWTVDVYLDDISPDLYNWLIDEYSNERLQSDGEIYRRIRQYQREANAHFEARWVARLSENKARRLRALESRPRIRTAFDCLLALPALLVHGMQIGSLPEVLASNCDEEICHALTELYRYWSSLVGDDPAKMLRIDVHTVSTLQLLAPGVSSTDRAHVKGLVRSGAVFANFSTAERASIWKEMKRPSVIIPSLTSFFKDVRFLKSCANGVKMLVTPSEDSTTIRKALRAAFLYNDAENATYSVQTSETTFRRYWNPQSDAAELSYRQLWLYAIRHYAELSKSSLKKDAAGKFGHNDEDPQVLHGMAALAKRLGFQTPQIEELLQQSPDRLIARNALLHARPHDRFQFHDGELDRLVERITECFSLAVPRRCQPAVHPSGREVKKVARCGYPAAQAQVRDQPFLFVDHLNDTEVLDTTKVTSLFVRWNFYKTFFGKVSVPGKDDRTTRSDSIGVLPSPLLVPSLASESSDEDGGSPDQDTTTRKTHPGTKLSGRGFKKKHPPQSDPQSSHPESVVMVPSTTNSPLQLEMEIEDLDIILPVGNGPEVADQGTHVAGVIGGAVSHDACGGANSPRFLELEISNVAHSSQKRQFEPKTTEVLEVSEGSGDESTTEQGLVDDGKEVTLARSQSPADRVMEEHTSITGSQTTEEWSKSGGEIEKTLYALEGRRSRSGTKRSSRLSKNRTDVREKDRWKPYDRSHRRLQARGSPMPPHRESLEQAIKTLLQAADWPSGESMIQDGHGSGTQRHPEDRQSKHSHRAAESWMAEWAEIANGNPYESTYTGAPIQTKSRSRSPDREEFPALDPTNFSPEIDVHSRLNLSVTPHRWDQRQYLGLQKVASQLAAPFGARETETDPRENNTENISDWEKITTRTLASAGHAKCVISFLAPDNRGEWSHLVHKVTVNPSDLSPVAQVAAKDARERQAVFYDCHLHQLHPARCVDAAIEDGTYTVFITFGYELAVNEDTMASVGRALQYRNSHRGRPIQ